MTHVTKPHEVAAAVSQGATGPAGLPEIAPASAPSVASSVSTASTSYPDRYSSVSGPSFGCHGQLQPMERIICEDPSLAHADGIMGAIYRDLRAALGKADADALRAAQRGWLKQRKLTCPMSTSDLRSADQTAEKASCLRRATDRRISELWEILRPVGVN